LFACGDGSDGTGQQSPGPYRGAHAHTLLFGATDNAEAVQVVPGTNRVLVVASKARKLVLLEVGAAALFELDSRALFENDPSESEMTNLAVAPDGTWAAVTRTLIDKTGDTVVDCRGELVLVDIQAGTAFGDVLAQVSVGPMPDAVSIAADGAYALVANERDVVWGKCDGVEGLEAPSLSVVDLRQGPAAASETLRVEMAGNLDREPESVAFGADSDLFAATLQDSHEVAVGRLSDLMAKSQPTDADLVVTALPTDSLGESAWPDGVAAGTDAAGTELFAIAGEANDTLTLLRGDGSVAALVELTSADVPAAFPRDGSWGTSWFTPDSVAAFAWGDARHVAVSLKAAGAVAVWDVSDPEQVGAPQLIKVGREELSDASTPSSISPEGIAAAPDGSFLVTANEGESSVSLILPEM
jgi:DNA-binding beta-propeller fold protein YncE